MSPDQAHTAPLPRAKGTWRFNAFQVEAITRALEAKAQGFGGILAPVPTGGGKTLIAASLGTALGLRGAECVLVVPAPMRAKTPQYLQEYEHEFEIEAPQTVITYSDLSTLATGLKRIKDKPGAKPPNLLTALPPAGTVKLWIFDEAQNLRSEDSQASRVARELLKKSPGFVVLMSATLIARSLEDCDHLFEWVLGDRSPLPVKSNYRTRASLRAVTGASHEWEHGAPQDEDFDVARKWLGLSSWPQDWFAAKTTLTRSLVAERIWAHPCVVRGPEDSTNIPIRLIHHNPPIPQACVDALKNVEDWMLPDSEEGEPTGAVDMATKRALMRLQLSLGFYLRTGFQSPQDEAEYRQAWFAWSLRSASLSASVRARIQQGREADAVWDRFKRAAKFSQTQAVWVSEDVLRWIIERARKSPNPPILWYHHKALAAKLKALGVTTCEAGVPEPEETVLCALSIGHHGTGKRLERWSDQWVLEPPMAADRWDQLLGRTVRPGQKAPEVCVRVLQHTRAMQDRMTRAFDEARRRQELEGRAQKLLRAKKSSEPLHTN